MEEGPSIRPPYLLPARFRQPSIRSNDRRGSELCDPFRFARNTDVDPGLFDPSEEVIAGVAYGERAPEAPISFPLLFRDGVDAQKSSSQCSHRSTVAWTSV